MLNVRGWKLQTLLEMENQTALFETMLRGSGTCKQNGVKSVKSCLQKDTDGYARVVALLMKNEQFETMFDCKFVSG